MKLFAASIPFLLSLALGAISLKAEETGPQAGQKIAFMGDSITEGIYGDPNGTGYVRLVERAFKQQGKPIVVITAGENGNTSKDMLARLDKDVLSKKPDWMTLSCGVNDVWHGGDGVPLDCYKKNIAAIVDQATAAGIKVILLTPTMIGEDKPDAPANKMLDTYVDFIRSFAKERNLPLADESAAMHAAYPEQAALAPKLKEPLILTKDGVHPNGLGNEIMAATLLKAMGFTDEQIAQAREMWLDLPESVKVADHVFVSVRQYLKLREIANSQDRSVADLIGKTEQKDIPTLLKNPPTTGASSTEAAPEKQ